MSLTGYNLQIFLVVNLVSLVFLISGIQSLERGRVSPKCVYHKADFGILTNAASGVLDFFEKHTSDLVLDSGVGTRIVEDQLSLALNSNLKPLPHKLSNFLERLLKKTEGVTQKIIKDVPYSAEDKEYVLPWVITPSLFKTPEPYGWRNLSSTGHTSRKLLDSFEFGEAEVLNEHTSDYCIGHIFKGCELPDKCVEIFLRQPWSQYSLTHQVIYMLFAKQRGCLSLQTFQTKIGPIDYMNTLCNEVLIESTLIARENFPEYLRDLFSEQVLMCGLAGYEEFLRRDWLDIILSWRSSSSNCFPHYEGTEEKKRSTRRKRTTSIVKTHDGETCSSHFTALGIGVVGIHIRKFLEGCLI